MRSSLRALWLEVKASYWFVPSLLTAAAFVLALWTIQLDRIWGPNWLQALGWSEGVQPEGARAQLTVIAGAMISISSTVFAITIAAVAYASGNYGPRLLTNFMNDRGNQISLGVFIATFAYNLMILQVVRNPRTAAAGHPAGTQLVEGFVPQLSLLVSGLSVVIAVAVLVYFLHHIPASIRINTVLGAIGRRLLRDIEKRFPFKGSATDPAPRVGGEQLTARAVGYIEIIDFGELDRIAARHGLVITLAARTGDFVHPHLTLAQVEGAPLSPEIQQCLHQCFSLGENRTSTQDLEFLIDELVEIGVRALSPGINDPFTAITSMHWLGAALASLADRDLCQGPEQTHYDPARVRPIADDFGHFLKRSFGAMRDSAASNALAAKVFLERLQGVIAGAASEQRRTSLRDEARRLFEQARCGLDGPALAEVEERWRRFASSPS